MHKKKMPDSPAGGENQSVDEQEVKEEKQTAPECDCALLEANYKRALADYQNLLKQTARDKEEYYKFASEQILYELLPVYDNLKMSFAHADATASENGWHQGIEYIIKQFGEALARLGVEEVKTEGERFDYHSMEAVEKMPTADEAQDGMVEKLVKAGYKLHGKVIVPARVRVYEYKGK